MIFDNINSELSTLKHYMLDLRHENAEMKRSMSNLSSNHFELTKEVTQLKQLISHLMDKQALFNSSLSTLNKETKGIMRDNIQLKSKHEIFQIRLKNLQGSHERDSLQRISSPRLSSPPQIFVSPNKQEEKDDQLEFQISPRLENINKSTKDRLESLRKDLQDVFKKREENIEETPRAERETIMEEWSNPSELNISQSHSDRSQLTVITCPQGEHSFNAGYNNQGQPSSLMEQVEMLNIPQKDNFLYESVLDVSPKGGNTGNTPKGESKKKENSEKRSPFNIDIPQQTRQGNMDIMNGGLNATGMNIFGQVKPKVSTPTQLTPNLRPLIPLSSTASTTIGATQSSLLGSENYSYYPIYPGSEGNYTQTHTQMQRYDTSIQPGQKVVSEPVSYVYQDKRNPGMMDIKVKKELYLKEENMLVKVLDKLDEQPYKSGLGYPAESNQQLDSDLYRFINKDSMGLHQRHPGAQKTGIQDYNFTQKMMESVELPEHEKLVPHDTSTTLSNASRGTKKLKLFRKSLKPKEESPNSKNLNYGDQRLHTE